MRTVKDYLVFMVAVVVLGGLLMMCCRGEFVEYGSPRDGSPGFVEVLFARAGDNGYVELVGDSATPGTPVLRFIPGGQVAMGDPFEECGPDAIPVHIVNVDSFYMDAREVSWGVWTNVRTWALTHGYAISNAAVCTTNTVKTNFPVVMVNWVEALKWCNARSEMDGLTPVYCTDPTTSTVLRTEASGNGITNPCVRWDQNGWRLPTEAEWEKSARGGVSGLRYPWGNAFTNYNANVLGSGDPWEGLATYSNSTPVAYYDGNQIPAGTDMANAYGLYDMAGNVAEWCWDVHTATWYSDSGATNDNSHGPPLYGGGLKVVRGGGHQADVVALPYQVGCAFRLSISTYTVTADLGFRCVRK